MNQLARELGYPLVVKPDAQGSSLGVTIVREESELAAALANSFRLDDAVLLERAIIGPEWTLAVLDDLPLPLIRIGTGRAFFDFQAKYQDDTTSYEVAPVVSRNLSAFLTGTGIAACRALGTQGIARVDMMVDSTGQPWVLEVNTIPGMTDHSLVPKAATHIGISMPDLCNLQLASALGLLQTNAA